MAKKRRTRNKAQRSKGAKSTTESKAAGNKSAKASSASDSKASKQSGTKKADVNGSAVTLRALSDSETQGRISEASGWEFDQADGRLVRDFAFRDFKSALAFMNQVGDIAEAMDHHPEMYNVYNQVSLALMTHSVNGISDLDFELAKRINKLP